MAKKDVGIEDILRGRLEEIRAELEIKRTGLKPLEDEEKSLARMIAEYTRGSMGSSDITDNQVVSWLRAHSHEDDRKSTAEIAVAFGADGRGFSKRLPRMARDQLIAGDPRGGYYIAVKIPARRRGAKTETDTAAVST